LLTSSTTSTQSLASTGPAATLDLLPRCAAEEASDISIGLPFIAYFA